MTKRDWTFEFQLFDQENPRVYQTFKRYAFQLLLAGKSRISHGSILERMRWESDLQATDEYKVNQNFGRPMAERFVFEHPEHSGAFAFKKRSIAEVHNGLVLNGLR